MRIKLDENLGNRCAALIAAEGHDVTTVAEQKMAGAQDHVLIDVCAEEERCLLTLDLDFANPLCFPPERYAGVAVLRLPSKPGYEDLIDAVSTFIKAVAKQQIHGQLWIVESERVRIYKPREEDFD
jgi:predicted nuclease of predicted toxin-antitoxin system